MSEQLRSAILKALEKAGQDGMRPSDVWFILTYLYKIKVTNGHVAHTMRRLAREDVITQIKRGVYKLKK